MKERRNDRSIAALLLAQRLVDNDAEPLAPREFWSIVNAVGEPERLLLSSRISGAGQIGLAPELAERIARRMEAATSLAFELERLEQSGLTVVSALDDGYPGILRERLGTTAPPILHVAGNLELLAAGGVGVVGSRNADGEALGVAAAVAEEAARHSHPVVSGGARGIDQQAMAAALESGGKAVGVLAEALSRHIRKPPIRRSILEGRLCLCTPFKPTAGFSVANAMGRNRLIYALSQVTLVIASDEGQGGTWEGAVEALRGHLTDVAVWQGSGAGPGNAALVGLGGRAASSIQDVFSHRQRAPVFHPDAGQMSLEL